MQIRKDTNKWDSKKQNGYLLLVLQTVILNINPIVIYHLKNDLLTRKVSVEFVLEKIKRCNGDNHRAELGMSDADDEKLHRFLKMVGISNTA